MRPPKKAYESSKSWLCKMLVSAVGLQLPWFRLVLMDDDGLYDWRQQLFLLYNSIKNVNNIAQGSHAIKT